MISLMQDLEASVSEIMKSRRDVLVAGIAGAAALVARPLVASEAAGDPMARLREIVQNYGGEFGPARQGV